MLSAVWDRPDVAHAFRVQAPYEELSSGDFAHRVHLDV
jgi:hypothetical protein